MKICFFAGANSVHSHRWIRYFVDKGHNIYWISLMPFTEPLPDVYFYNIGPLSTNPIKIIFQALKVRRLIKKINPDVFHIHSAGTYGLIGALASFHPLIVTTWGSDVLLTSTIKKPFIRWALKKADLITCDADHMIEAMKKLGADESKMRLVYFGVETDKFMPGEKDKELVEKLELGNSPIVISLRNLEPVYDIETLIKAIPEILQHIANAKFIIAGSGSQENYLKDIAKLLRIMESIKFIGRYSHNELRKYLTTADVYVSTSLSDAGIAASTAEAMTCGLPVIITDSGENKKWVKDGENGFVIPVKNPKILAEKIIYLLKNEDVRKMLGEAGRRTIEEKNNYYREMEKMGKIYEEIVKKNSLRRENKFY